MQLVAMLTMLVDHIGYVWFPGDEAWRIVGRMAFPLYAYGLVVGFQRTRSRSKYLGRLAVLAVLSQLPFALIFNGINVIASFVVCLAVLWLLDRYDGWIVRAVVVLVALALLETLPFDYGAYGLLLVLMYRYVPIKAWLYVHLALNVGYVTVHGWIPQLYSVAATLLLVYWRNGYRLRVPRWLWRGFYPVHLAAIVAFVYIAYGGERL